MFAVNSPCQWAFLWEFSFHFFSHHIRDAKASLLCFLPGLQTAAALNAPFSCWYQRKKEKNNRKRLLHSSRFLHAAPRLWHLCFTAEFMLCQVPHRLCSLSWARGARGIPGETHSWEVYWNWRQRQRQEEETIVQARRNCGERLHRRRAKGAAQLLGGCCSRQTDQTLLLGSTKQKLTLLGGICVIKSTSSGLQVCPAAGDKTGFLKIPSLLVWNDTKTENVFAFSSSVLVHINDLSCVGSQDLTWITVCLNTGKCGLC